MNFNSKIGPLVAELLSGIAALLVFYLKLHGLSFKGVDELSSAAIILLLLLAWIMGTFFDMIRNLAVERAYDHFAFRLNWTFFFLGDKDRLTNFEQYFWSFYLVDTDIAISLFISVTLSTLLIKTPLAPWYILPVLLFVAFLFAVDAATLRYEIKVLLDEEWHQP